jgi:hypothetical protein
MHAATDSDRVEYVNVSVINTQWVETVSLPTYSSDNSGKSKFTKLNLNYTYIKHMMSELGLRLNRDYIIMPTTTELRSIDIKFTEHSQHYASMCVLIWERYKTAKIESNL